MEKPPTITSAQDCCEKPAQPGPTDISGNAPPGGLWRTGLVAMGAAILASACCWLPVLLLAVGASAAGAAANVIASLRYPLLGIAAIALGLAFYRAYFRRRTGTAAAVCCSASGPTRRAGGRLALWASTVLVILFAAFPYYGAPLIRAVSGGGASHAATTTATPHTPAPAASYVSAGKVAKTDAAAAWHTYNYQVKGMDCTACAAGLQAVAARLPGVKTARVSYTHGSVVITADPHTFDPQTLVRKFTAAGYPTALLSQRKEHH